MRLNKVYLLVCLVSIVATAALIYLTPLKHIALIEPTVRDVESQEFYAKYKENPDQYLFVDVRSADAYTKLHAQGSVSMPLHTLYNLHSSLPRRGKEIVLICSGGVASGVAYSYLQHFGFFNIVRIDGGIEKWIAAGLPTAEGSSPQ